jgi:hypothetical protein
MNIDERIKKNMMMRKYDFILSKVLRNNKKKHKIDRRDSKKIEKNYLRIFRTGILVKFLNRTKRTVIDEHIINKNI